MDSTLKWVLIGAGGLLLYDWWQTQQVTSAATTTTGTISPTSTGITVPPVGTTITLPPTTTTVKPPPPTSTPPPAVTGTGPSVAAQQATASLELKAGYGPTALLTADQHNYFYQQVQALMAAPIWGGAGTPNIGGSTYKVIDMGPGGANLRAQPPMTLAQFFSYLTAKGLHGLGASPQSLTRARFLMLQQRNQQAQQQYMNRLKAATVRNNWSQPRTLRQVPLRWVM